MKFRVARLPASTLVRRLALAYLIVWVLSPPLAYGTAWRALALAAMGAWLALELAAPRSVLLKPSWPVLGTLVFAGYTGFVEWLVPDAAEINRHFQIWIMFFFLLVGESLGRGRDGDARMCFWLVLLVLPVWSITTLRGIETIALDVARTISRSSDEARALAAQGVGGYGFVHTVLLCLPFLAWFATRPRSTAVMVGARSWRKRGIVVLLVLNFLLGYLLLLRAGYTIGLVLAAFAFCLVLLVRTRGGLRLAISLVLSATLVVLAAFALRPALDGLQAVATGTEYSAKVRDVRRSLDEDQSTGTVGDRAERYQRSARLAMENPVLGTLTFDDVGKHSAVLDRFAQYGFAIGSLFLLLLAYLPWRLVRDWRVPFGSSLALLVIAVAFPLLNNVFMSWGLILYVFSRGALAVMGVPLQRERRLAFAPGVPAHA
jgi:hypothetical protein